jgi:hypothetical protein
MRAARGEIAPGPAARGRSRGGAARRRDQGRLAVTMSSRAAAKSFA